MSITLDPVWVLIYLAYAGIQAIGLLRVTRHTTKEVPIMALYLIYLILAPLMTLVVLWALIEAGLEKLTERKPK